MKRIILSLCSIICIGINYVGAQDALRYSLPNSTERHVGVSYSENAIIPLDSTVIIDGMTISGHVTFQNRHSLFRVVLIDLTGKEYLLYEGRYWGTDTLVQYFDNMAIETIHMEQMSPANLRIAVNNVTLYIDNINFSIVSKNKQQVSSEILLSQRKARLDAYYSWKTNKWHEYIANKSIPWIVGETSASKLSYSDKKKYFGITNDNFNLYGLEHYVGGIFVFPDTALSEFVPITRENLISQYVDHFDWRNRHGKNWMTHVKNQHAPNEPTYGNGGCWAFAALASVESRLNLYYNKLLNVDLSEQELGSCGAGHLSNLGGWPHKAFQYIIQHGITTEDCFPFYNNDTIPCSAKCDIPEQVITFTKYDTITNSNTSTYVNIDTILKQEIIKHGPIAGIMNNSYYNHAMCMCGYGTIHIGDSVHSITNGHASQTIIIDENSPYIGQTYWIYKNSVGGDEYFNGYLYALYENPAIMKSHHSPHYPIRTSILGDTDIAVTDADNDGYYFWGLGSKPAHCPVCCPDIPDGDDSDPIKGEMDSYGNFAPYTFPYPSITVTSDTTWNINQTQCGNIIITDNATLTLTAELTMNPAAKIIVQNGGTLIINAGIIQNATIDVQSSAKLQLLNNGTLYLKQFGNLNVHLGAEADLNYGRVLLQ